MEIRHIELTAESVKVLAHPLRSRLLSALRMGGPATATALATTLHTNSGATSYHLRRLEAVGLVVDTGKGKGKERLWAASTESHGWHRSAFADDEDARTAMGWLERDYARTYDQRFNAWLDVAESWPAAWQDVLSLSDTWVEVTPEQLAELNEEMNALVLRYIEAGAGDPRARRIALYRSAMPLNLEYDQPSDDQPSDTPEES